MNIEYIEYKLEDKVGAFSEIRGIDGELAKECLIHKDGEAAEDNQYLVPLTPSDRFDAKLDETFEIVSRLEENYDSCIIYFNNEDGFKGIVFPR